MVPFSWWNYGKTYNGFRASRYAKRFAKKYNTPYYMRHFNDCANFISQSLYSGGWRNELGYYTSNDAWWYGHAG